MKTCANRSSDPARVFLPLCTTYRASLGRHRPSPLIYSEHFYAAAVNSHTVRQAIYLEAIDQKKGVLHFKYMRTVSRYRPTGEESRQEESIVSHDLSEGRVVSYRAFRKVEGALDYAMEPVDIHIHEVSDNAIVYELRPAPGATFQLPVKDAACT